MTMTGSTARYDQVRRVLFAVLIANLLVSAVKVGLGVITGALAVVADGFHSLVDSSSNLIGLAAIRLAKRRPDEQHPYGYQRYETLGSLAIGGLLLAAVWEIVRNIFSRLLNGAHPEVTSLTFWLVVATLPINLAIVVLETRAGRRLESQILLADATHTRTDLFVTASVIASLVGVRLGLPWLDLVVASAVVLLILRASFDILRQSATLLADAIVTDPSAVDALARQVPGVLYVHRIRSRGKPDAAFVDLHVKVPPEMSTEQAHAIASEVEHRLKRELPGVVDALVHIEPALGPEQPSPWEQMAYRLRQIADGLGLGLHDLHIAANGEGYTAEMHLEFRGAITLGEAHRRAEDFRRRVQNEVPLVQQVILHLEPLPQDVLPAQDAEGAALRARIERLLRRSLKAGQVRSVRLQRIGDHLSVVVLLGLPADLPLTEAHHRAEEAKRLLLSRFPELHRVMVQVEPLD